ncbi:MAG TPA: hypothetical protein PK568_09050 [Bacillota bacterium]|nr:hypothetical protein [Bacillota bacterium]
MKRFLLLLAVIMAAAAAFLAAGCTLQADGAPGDDETAMAERQFSEEERKRMDLYLAAMKGAFREENGGRGFIAVKMDTLVGLSEEAKLALLDELKVLSPNVYREEDIINDPTKIRYDEEGRFVGTINGSLLWVHLHEYDGDSAEITGGCTFGNLGAVLPRYEAVYKHGKWQLKIISMGMA